MGEIIPYMTWYTHPVTSLFDGVLSLVWRLRVSDQRAQGFSLATRDRPFSREVLCVQEGARLASADRNEDISHFTQAKTQAISHYKPAIHISFTAHTYLARDLQIFNQFNLHIRHHDHSLHHDHSF